MYLKEFHWFQMFSIMQFSNLKILWMPVSYLLLCYEKYQNENPKGYRWLRKIVIWSYIQFAYIYTCNVLLFGVIYLLAFVSFLYVYCIMFSVNLFMGQICLYKLVLQQSHAYVLFLTYLTIHAKILIDTVWSIKYIIKV